MYEDKEFEMVRRKHNLEWLKARAISKASVLMKTTRPLGSIYVKIDHLGGFDFRARCSCECHGNFLFNIDDVGWSEGDQFIIR